MCIAPNSYNLQDADKTMHENSPKYTFGAKTNGEKPLDTPGLLQNDIFFFSLSLDNS